jgi:hypothetical protein
VLLAIILDLEHESNMLGGTRVPGAWHRVPGILKNPGFQDAYGILNFVQDYQHLEKVAKVIDIVRHRRSSFLDLMTLYWDKQSFHELPYVSGCLTPLDKL